MSYIRLVLVVLLHTVEHYIPISIYLRLAGILFFLPVLCIQLFKDFFVRLSFKEVVSTNLTDLLTFYRTKNRFLRCISMQKMKHFVRQTLMPKYCVSAYVPHTRPLYTHFFHIAVLLVRHTLLVGNTWELDG